MNYIIPFDHYKPDSIYKRFDFPNPLFFNKKKDFLCTINQQIAEVGLQKMNKEYLQQKVAGSAKDRCKIKRILDFFSSNRYSIEEKVMCSFFPRVRVEQPAMTKHKKESQTRVSSDTEGVAPKGTKKKLFDVSFFKAWCKTCGLCEALCPKGIIKADKTGFPEIVDTDRCNGCRFCEKHCPDFSISVVERTPKRRKTDG